MTCTHSVKVLGVCPDLLN